MGIVLGILLFLLLSGFFSGSEIAFVSANKLGVAMEEAEGSRRGNIITRFYKKPSAFISTMLVGNNIALVAFTYFMTIFFESLFPGLLPHPVVSLLLQTLLITIVILIFGEFIPKTVFRLYANNALLSLAYPLAFFKFFLAPLTWMMNKLSSLILRIFRVPMEKMDYTLSKLDVQNYLEDQISETQDEIDRSFLTNALNLRDLQVRDCMVPRTEIVSFDVNEGKREEIIELFKSTKLSRVLLIDHDIENVLGYIHHQQLLHEDKSLRKLAIKIPYAPEAMNLKDLLNKFIKTNTNIACVVDEFGSTSGVITLEDIVEEIFGEIEDEFDDETVLDQKVSDKEFLFSGRIEINYINEKYEGINIPEGDYQTLSGYIVMTSGTIPEMDSEIILGNYKFVLVQVSDTKIEIVRMILLDNSPEVSP